MCLGIPMQISTFSNADKHIAHCTQGGIKRDVNIYLLQDPAPSIGDYVLVHVGYAIQIIDTDDALHRNTLFDKMKQLDAIENVNEKMIEKTQRKGDINDA